MSPTRRLTRTATIILGCAAALLGLRTLPAIAIEPAAAQGRPESAPEPPPLPPPRPEGEVQAESAAPSLPPARPGPAGAVLPASDPEPPCVAELAGLGIAATPLGSLGEGPCRVEHAVDLTRLPGPVAVPAGTHVVCPMAKAVARWTTEVVAPAARRELGRTLSAVAVGTSYACRGQNNVVGAKLSEHAAANALDIASFGFTDGPSVGVKASDAGTPEGRFIAAVRTGACAIFTTVLGPGSDASHTDHLHLDLRDRPHGYRICE